jgi:hypothetical protein
LPSAGRVNRRLGIGICLPTPQLVIQMRRVELQSQTIAKPHQEVQQGKRVSPTGETNHHPILAGHQPGVGELADEVGVFLLWHLLWVK